MNERKIPRNAWPRVPLESVAAITDGDWILTSDYAPRGVRLLQVGDIGCGRFIGKSSRFVSESRAQELHCTLLRSGDVLISRMPDPIGRACLLPDLGYPCITAVDVSILRARPEEVDSRYLVHLFSSKSWFEQVAAEASGATRARISRSNLQKLLIPIPSLPDQQRIVAKLDQQMTALDRAEKALADQQAAASDFLQAALEAVFGLAAHPAWPQVRLDAVSDVIDRKVDPQQHASQMYAHYSIPAFDTGEGPIFELGSEIRSAKCEVADDCVLFSKLNPRIPRVWHVHDHVDVPRICSTEFLVLQPKLEHVIATYLTWILQSPPFLRTIRSRVQAATKSRERVPENVVVSTPILVPSLGEQQRIVAKLDEQLMSLGFVQSALAHQTADLGTLRSTLLNAAFSGEI